ncbi:SANT and BTB domain regulator of class switch recombination-like [Amphiura filiformis]|uniref:SANT and BTB domain regulator of class switch recombination-like n=1 Tax=Amphiura filiformis TaxID=82378 RepID=UPI003B2163A3
MNRRDSPSRAVALDLMLRTFMNSSEFNDIQNKNWDAIAKLIPGTTPQECAKRFQELQSAAGDIPPVGNISSLAACGRPVPRGRPTTANTRLARTSSCGLEDDEEESKSVKQESGLGVNKGEAHKPQEQHNKSTVQEPKKVSPPTKPVMKSPSEPQGPNMVIHVCDEAKNVKRDFQCPRDLLIVEMRYFAEYLSTEAQRWEEVDISVHCDVQIFQWLMRYVKRNSIETMGMEMPKLEPTNVISILISSDFLKMDSLVTECIHYCHKNMSAIVATPCNMNCINDRLCVRIADLFTDIEADAVKDKRDKFKSKLFCKKIEKLFESNGAASTLHRCSFCKRYLTKNLQSKLSCLPSRMSIDGRGNISYHHQRDTNWDINEFVLRIRNELKSWREVYWRLWGVVNCLTCSRCKQVFACSELGHCCYHPEPAKFNSSLETHMSNAIGMYGCCEQSTLRFDPLEQNVGCQVKDHIATVSVMQQDGDTQASPTQQNSNDSRILDILLQRREFICIPPRSPEPDRFKDINLFSGEEALCGVISEGIGVKGQLQHIFPDDNLPLEKQEPLPDDPMTPDEDMETTTDDEVGDDEPARVSKHRQRIVARKASSRGVGLRERITHPVPVDAGSGMSYVRKKWDTQRSLRWNQDAQREEDRQRNQLLVSYLVKQRAGPVDKRDKSKSKEYTGGIYSRLEAQFRSSLQVTKQPPSGATQRSKTRTGQNRTT